jgi:hypothetical protein
MSEDLKNTQKKENGDIPAPSSDQLWNQLGNAVVLVGKQDQIVWAVFAAFWAANAVLLVALFTTGKLPEASVGAIVSGVGFVLSVVWLAIEYRAVAWLRFYEGILREVELNHLQVPLPIAFTGHPEQVKGVTVRWLILACPSVSALLWAGAALRFLCHW